MTKFHVVKQVDTEIPQKLKDALRHYLFEIMDGFTDGDKKSWRRFWHRVNRLAAGEIISFEAIFPRNSLYHRKYMALLNYAYDCWTPNRKHRTHKGVVVQKNFDHFRKDIAILAGYYDVTFDLDGKMELEAKSIAFANMEEAEFEELYSATINVILDKILKNYKGRQELDDVIHNILRFGN